MPVSVLEEMPLGEKKWNIKLQQGLSFIDDASRCIHARGPFIRWNEKYVENVLTMLHICGVFLKYSSGFSEGAECKYLALKFKTGGWTTGLL